MELSAVTGAIERGRATITIDRPGKHNAMTTPTWEKTTELVQALAATRDARLIVLRGRGDAFSAGADLGEVLAATTDLAAARHYCHTIVRTLLTVAASPGPTVAALDGIASGGGVELAIAADHRIATPRTTLQLPFARLGVVPDAFTLDRLRTLTGASFAQWMIINGEPVDAEACRQRGLIDELAPLGGLDAALDRLHEQVARTSMAVVMSTWRRLGCGRPAYDVEAAASAMVESFLGGEVESAARQFSARKSLDS